jgi:hypothetical protein
MPVVPLSQLYMVCLFELGRKLDVAVAILERLDKRIGEK